MSIHEDFEQRVGELYDLSMDLDDDGNVKKFDRLANYLYSLFMGNVVFPLLPSQEKFVAILCSATVSGLEYWRGVGETLSRIIQLLRVRGFDQIPSARKGSLLGEDVNNAARLRNPINHEDNQPSFLD